MTGFAVAMLFGAALAFSLATLFVSIRPQLHRFAELWRPASSLPPLPPRAARLTVRTVVPRPAPLPTLRAAA